MKTYCNFWVLRCIIFKCSKKYTNDHNANIKTIAAGMASANYRVYLQGTKKFRSDSPGLVNFAVGLVEFILHLPDGQVKVFGEIVL